MSKTGITIDDLKSEIYTLSEQFPRFQEDALFVLWFLRAFVTEDLIHAAESVSGGKGDKGVDAILIDDKAKIVFIIQGKYREEIFSKNENRNDVITFAELSTKIAGDKETFNILLSDCIPNVEEKMKETRERVLNRNYRLQLYYATLGRCSKELEKEAINIVKKADCNARIEISGGRRLLLLLADYLEGVAPPVPSAELEMEAGGGVKVNGILQRYDIKTDIDSWVFSMNGDAISEIYERSGTRIFARNVRGFLGETKVNRSMSETLYKEPEFFWYYNNGITIICDKAEQRTSRGRDILYVENPQIINGQQTTRMLNRLRAYSPKSSVLVRVIRVPREPGKRHENFENLISSIVSATNWQNQIKASDLMSTDRRQIEIERELRRLGYLYIRKRQSKPEARRLVGANRFFAITKEETAQAVAACDLDPANLRLGKEILFEEDLYKVVFPNSDPYYYLCRYWLAKRVAYAAKGYPERGYAKWLIVNFIWPNLRKILKTRRLKETFISNCEKGPYYKENEYLLKASNSAFNAVLSFYRKERGKGATAIDVSSFFRKKALNKDFEIFWNSKYNRFKNAFDKSWDKFEKGLIITSKS